MSASDGGVRAALRGDRALEILAIILLGIATVGTAWCGYQASSWNGEQGDLARQASDLHLEANRQFTLSIQAINYDANLVVEYAKAYQEKNTALMGFYRSSLIRPAFLPILDEWEAKASAGTAPPNLLTDQAYLDAQLSSYRSADKQAADRTLESEAAGRNADAYVLTTLLLATALFFAGVTSSFRFRTGRVLLLIGAVAAIAVAAARMIDLPVV